MHVQQSLTWHCAQQSTASAARTEVNEVTGSFGFDTLVPGYLFVIGYTKEKYWPPGRFGVTGQESVGSGHVVSSDQPLFVAHAALTVLVACDRVVYTVVTLVDKVVVSALETGTSSVSTT